MKPADKLFESYLHYLTTEEEVMDDVINTLGIDPDSPDDWPFDDYSHDYYDHSFELDDVDVGWEPTELAVEMCWKLGFHRFWLNYKDGTEKYYYEKN